LLYRVGRVPDFSKKEYHMSTPTLKKTDDINKVREYIRKLIELKYGTLTAYANKEEVSLQYISNVMSGNKPIPAWMYKRFKINHVVHEHWEVTLKAA
jgi:hypothetical protein